MGNKSGGIRCAGNEVEEGEVGERVEDGMGREGGSQDVGKGRDKME